MKACLECKFLEICKMYSTASRLLDQGHKNSANPINEDDFLKLLAADCVYYKENK